MWHLCSPASSPECFEKTAIIGQTHTGQQTKNKPIYTEGSVYFSNHPAQQNENNSPGLLARWKWGCWVAHPRLEHADCRHSICRNVDFPRLVWSQNDCGLPQRQKWRPNGPFGTVYHLSYSVFLLSIFFQDLFLINSLFRTDNAVASSPLRQPSFAVNVHASVV